MIWSPEERDIVLRKTDGLCAYCGSPLEANFQVDHFIPKTRGGCSSPSNLVPSCGPCNNSKGDRLLEEWRTQVAKRRFRDATGMPYFSPQQRDYLATIGVDLFADVEPVDFWFERVGIDIHGHQYATS